MIRIPRLIVAGNERRARRRRCPEAAVDKLVTTLDWLRVRGA